VPLVWVRRGLRVVTWPPRDLFAVTLDGTLLVNARALEADPDAQVSGASTTFYGATLTRKEAQLLRAAIAEAATEAVARIDGARRARRRRDARRP
jgi:hypothetical protein